MEQQSTSLNIVILPDETTRDKIITMSQKVSGDLQTHFALNTTNLFAHITLYQAHYPNANHEQLKEKLRDFAKTITPFMVTMQSVDVAYDTFIFWDCLKTDELNKLHMDVVNMANPMRQGQHMPQLNSVTNLKPEDEADKAQYGALGIGPRYRPHITISRLENPSDKDKAKQLLADIQPTSFRVEKLTLGYLGDHGTVTGIIEEFPLPLP